MSSRLEDLKRLAFLFGSDFRKLSHEERQEFFRFAQQYFDYGNATWPGSFKKRFYEVRDYLERKEALGAEATNVLLRELGLAKELAHVMPMPTDFLDNPSVDSDIFIISLILSERGVKVA